MKTLLFWLLPPFIGAVIGYVTNAIAIKMLFRPLSEKRLFRIRIPFTPGILPRQRHKLANNIGRMVAQELLTESIIRNRLQNEDFRQATIRAMAEITEKILNRSLIELTKNNDLIDRLRTYLKDSPVIISLLGEVLKKILVFLADKTPDELLSPELKAALAPSIGNGLLKLATYLEEDRFKEKLSQFLQKQLANPKSLAELVPAELEEDLAKLSLRLFPSLSSIVLSWMNLRSTRQLLESNGRIFLQNVLLKLNVFQRLFLSAAQYDKSLTERMPEIIDELIVKIEVSLKSAGTASAFAVAVQQAVHKLLPLTAEQALGSFNISADDLAGSLCKLISWLAKDRQGLTVLVDWLYSLLTPTLQQPLRFIIEDRLGLQFQTIVDSFSQMILNGLTKFSGTVPWLEELFTAISQQPFTKLFNLTTSHKERLDFFLTDNALKLIDQNVDGLLAGLDIKKIVSDRIDDLDMLSVEHLVLDVLADQLRWINVFGAILGSLIGLVQVLFTWLIR